MYISIILNDDGVTGRQLLTKWHPCNTTRWQINVWFSFVLVHVAWWNKVPRLDSTRLDSTRLDSTRLDSTLSLSLSLFYSTLLYSTLLYSTLLYSTLLYSTLLYSTLLYSTLLFALVSCLCSSCLLFLIGCQKPKTAMTVHYILIL